MLSFHASRIVPFLISARSHVEQLVLACGATWQDRSALLQTIAADQGFIYTAIGLPFAKTLIGQTPGERALSVMEMLDNLVPSAGPGIALDKIEILFDPDLRMDPIRAIQRLAHRQLILLSWPGKYDGSRLIYAWVDHAEYRTYPASDMLVYSLETLT